jgi:hypothetical protein
MIECIFYHFVFIGAEYYVSVKFGKKEVYIFKINFIHM